MQADEARHLGRLAGTAVGGAVRGIHGIHAAVAGRIFRVVGPSAAPVQVVHDAVAKVAYQSVALGLATASKAGGLAGGVVAAERARTAPPRRLSDAPRAQGVVGVLNGAHGDLLEREYPALALPMTVRSDGRDVGLDSQSLAAAFAPAGPRIAVFLHGLVETEEAWRYKAVRHYGDASVTYGSRLRRDLGFVPVWIRYNSGRHISDNGRDLAVLMERLIEGWPVPIEDIVLIGHSMGGLVARSALAQAGEGTAYGDRHWPGLVRDTVTLAAPHLGAPLEVTVNKLGHRLDRIPELRWLGGALARRSVGIKDLRFGNLLESDWADAPSDARTSSRTAVALHDGARHFAVLTTLVGRHDSRLGEWVGDLLVRPASAIGDTGDHRRLGFEEVNIRRMTGLHHLELLNHPEVYQQIHSWLACLGR
jgi:pimeloyl-ACP methyl ester carboxylesterase